MKPIYWDNNATTPVAPEVLEAMLPYLSDELFYNPSAAYPQAKRVRRALDDARERVAALLGARPSEIAFTSGGTEATNTALTQFRRVLAPATEHPATLRHAHIGAHCPVGAEGLVELAAWRDMLPGHDGASFSLANHETGVLAPAADLCAAAAEAGVAVHVDAVQAAGKLPLALHDLPAVAYASLSAHKLHGPKGVGALYVRTGAPLRPALTGGKQEDARRAGTENVPGIIGFGKAAELALAAAELYARLSRLRERFLAALAAAGISVVQNGAGAPRLPHVLNLRVPGCTAEALSLLLEPAGLLCSAGSACTSADPTPSHVLLAMGLTPQQARESLRFSWNRYATEQQVDEAAAIFSSAVLRLRSVQSARTGGVMVYTP